MATASSNVTPKIVLHWLESSRSHRILWLLEELQVPYELKTYKRTKDGRAPSELKKIHPLGKSPVVTIEPFGSSQPLILAESAAIAEYLCGYFGSSLVPVRYKKGQEGQIGGETEPWMRYRHFMHYTEGSLSPVILVSIIINTIRTSPVPFFIKPITNGIAKQITSLFLKPEFEAHYKFLESQLETSPHRGRYLCGKELTVADVLILFPLEIGRTHSGMTKEQFPRVWDYTNSLLERDAYKRAVRKIVEVDGSFKMEL